VAKAQQAALTRNTYTVRPTTLSEALGEPDLEDVYKAWVDQVRQHAPNEDPNDLDPDLVDDDDLLRKTIKRIDTVIRRQLDPHRNKVDTTGVFTDYCRKHDELTIKVLKPLASSNRRPARK
jgi:hypothetical protein